MSEKDMLHLIAIIERALGAAWVDATEWLRNIPANSIAAIEARLMAGDIAGAVSEVESAALAFAAETQAAYVRAGRTAAQWLDAHPTLKDRLIRFDDSGNIVNIHARRNQMQYVRGMTDESRLIVRHVMSTSTERNPRAWAREIRDSIGLTDNQQQYVSNYRRALERADWNKALGYELSDGNADRTIRRLQRDGGSLPPEQVDRMVERYRRNQIAWRAENIARTESARNVHAGIEESFRQAIERGDLVAEDIEAEWHPGPVTRHARKDHRSSFLLEQRPKWGEPFRMPSGARMRYPGDGELGAGAEDIAHCRCTRSLTLA